MARPAARAAACRRRIYIGTVDARLIALDGATGAPCRDFGDSGTVNLREGLRAVPLTFPWYQITSPPTVVGDLVVTGSSIADNGNVRPASGEVRAFDARSGALRWRWDPIPQDERDPAFRTWRDSSAVKTGAANVWSVIVADSARDLLFVPTSSLAPDWGPSEDDRAACRAMFDGRRNEGIFTPPSLEGTLVLPSNIGGAHWGSPNLGGPIATAGGLVFIGATLDRAIRAFDIETGRELWRADLPAGARATPMTYEAGGRQFVLLAAGGADLFGDGDAIVAFALPR